MNIFWFLKNSINKKEEINSPFKDKKIFIKYLLDKKIDFEKKLMIKNLFYWEITIEDIKKVINKLEKREKYLLANELEKTAENINFLIKLWLSPENFLFNCKSDGWKIFDEILKNTLKNNSDIYTEMKKIVLNFIEKQNLEKNIFSEKDSKRLYKIFKNNHTNNDEDFMKFGFYIRYWHKIDHPEIAELIIIFFDEILKNQSLKYFKDFKIFTRFKNKFYPKNFSKFIKKEKILLLEWMEFENEINNNYTIFYFSNSSSPKTNFPNFISKNMKKWKNSFNLDLEFENKFWDKYFNQNLKSDKILKFFLEKIQRFENLMSFELKQREIWENFSKKVNNII